MFRYFCVLLILVMPLSFCEEQDYSAPSAAHKLLNPIAGYWKTSVTVYAFDGSTLLEDKGFCHNSWILGKRFILNRHIFPNYESAGVIGYDNYKKKYVSALIDKRDTNMHFFEGEGFVTNDNHKYFLMEGTTTGFDGQSVVALQQIKFEDENSYTLEVLHRQEKRVTPVVKMVYKRVDANTAKRTFPKGIHQVPAEYMKDKNKINYPTLYHHKLKVLGGTWNIESGVYDEAGNLVRMNKGNAENHWILGRSFMSMRVNMEDYESRGLMGYNTHSKKYVLAYVDSRSTSIQKSEGSAVKADFVLHGDAIDYSTKKPEKLVYSIRVRNKDHYIFKMYRDKDMTSFGFKTLKVKYFRKK